VTIIHWNGGDLPEELPGAHVGDRHYQRDNDALIVLRIYHQKRKPIAR
jgi:hypothetical protein